MTFTQFLEKFAIPLIAAIGGAIFGAIQAFRYQRKMEIQRDKRQLMQLLMSYRSIGAIEVDWIRALNMIDIVFHDSKEIKALLRSYMFHTDETRFHTKEHERVLVELLYEMGQSCSYTDLTAADIRDAYNPIAINHIYASTIAKLAQSGASSAPPPSTNP